MLCGSRSQASQCIGDGIEHGREVQPERLECDDACESDQRGDQAVLDRCRAFGVVE